MLQKNKILMIIAVISVIFTSQIFFKNVNNTHRHNSHTLIDTIPNIKEKADSVRGYIKKYDIEHTDNLMKVEDEIIIFMHDECTKNNIPKSIFFRIIDKESGFRFIKNTGGSGAMGYMQVMPQTYKGVSRKIGLKGDHDKKNNIIVGANLIRLIHSFWVNKQKKSGRESWEYTLAEYACGRKPMQLYNIDSTKVIGYHIPENVKPGIERVLKYY